MPQVRLPRCGIETSRLVLGLSRLHHLHSTKERQNLLGAAADLGIRQFDAARLYGDGLAERELGLFLRSRRNEFVVATKYGLPANALIEALPQAALPLRAIRSMARRVELWPASHPPFTAAGLRASIARSLRALQTDRIDVLLLHQPSLDRMPDPAALMAEAERQKRNGTIRLVGLAGDYPDVVTLARQCPSLADVIQVAEDQWSETCVPDLTFSVMRRDGQSAFEATLDTHTALERLRTALQRRPNGAVIVSTTNAGHLRTLAAVAQETSP